MKSIVPAMAIVVLAIAIILLYASAYVVEEGIEFTPEEWADAERDIRTRISEYVISNAYGMDESYRIRIENDEVVQKAIELFPQAMELASLALDGRRTEGDAAALVDGDRQAQAP